MDNEIAPKLVEKLNGKKVEELKERGPFIYKNQAIRDKNEKGLLLVRGWGRLIGGYNLKPSEAIELQDKFCNLCVNLLNQE